MPLPMACTLSHFPPGHRYHFAVRAIDEHARIGPFSDPQSIFLDLPPRSTTIDDTVHRLLTMGDTMRRLSTFGDTMRRLSTIDDTMRRMSTTIDALADDLNELRN